MKDFKDYTYDDAAKLFSTDRRTKTALNATEFKNGNHWQDGKGFLGEMPPVGHPSYSATKTMLEEFFVSVNVTGEVVENHGDGLLGREPIWSFLSDNGTEKTKEAETTYAPLTDWWNERERLSDLQKAVEILLCEGVAVKHIFFPRGFADATGNKIGDSATVEVPDLAKALELIYCETCTADVAGVFTDPDTQRQIGVYLFERGEESAKEKWAELSFLNDAGETVVKRVSKGNTVPEETTYKLGGRLLVYEMRRKALITEQVQSTQKALNLSYTMMMRNVNLAGARERTVGNAQKPKDKKKVADPNSPTGVKIIEEDGVYVTGGGAVNFLLGWPLYGENGKIVGYTNPNVTITDPVPVDTFKDTNGEMYAAIYGQCQQRHILISGDATVSGRSREQARKEYESSLKKTSAPVDAAGRWELETVLRLAAQLSNQSEKYLRLRADFSCIIDIGKPDAQERSSVMEMRQPGGVNNQPLISDETARGWCGVDDNEAEVKRIEAEADVAAQRAKTRPQTSPPPLDDRTGDDLPA
jgi:hypothetical protein